MTEAAAPHPVVTTTAPDAPGGRRYGGAGPEQRVAERRAKIIEAGVELFGRRGFQATTMAMLSAESGVPHRYLVQIFPTREDLLREIYLGIYHDVTVAVRASRQAAEMSPAALIRTGVRAACDTFLLDFRKTRINCLDVVGVSPAFEQLRRATIREFCRLILEDVEKLVAAGLLPPRDYLYGAIGLVGAFTELMTEWVLAEEGQRPPQALLVRQIEEFFWATLLATQYPLPDA
ncbi:MAG: TetR/AcrR family transcriptional regulator [Moraxellaceae bacterium]|nr:TetR/AcrR family transcriptional regulator [Moraxellaceae bacterium]